MKILKTLFLLFLPFTNLISQGCFLTGNYWVDTSISYCEGSQVQIQSSGTVFDICNQETFYFIHMWKNNETEGWSHQNTDQPSISLWMTSTHQIFYRRCVVFGNDWSQPTQVIEGGIYEIQGQLCIEDFNETCQDSLESCQDEVIHLNEIIEVLVNTPPETIYVEVLIDTVSLISPYPLFLITKLCEPTGTLSFSYGVEPTN